jgi:hypothetical protein
MIDGESEDLSRRSRAGACTSQEGITDMAKEDSSEDSKSASQSVKTNGDGLAEGVSMQEDWRDLVQQIQQETDTHKLVNLVQELISKFDEEKLRKATHRLGGAA